jgi:hypothetical protein
MSSLADTLIAETYNSVLHSNALPLPSTGLVIIHDGIGNRSSLSLGREGSGISVSGPTSFSSLSTNGLNVGNLRYPSVAGPIGSVLYQRTSTEFGYLSTVPNNSVLTTNFQPLPVTGRALVYDGSGNISSISIGRANSGMFVSGTLASNALSSTTVTGGSGSIGGLLTVGSLRVGNMNYPTSVGSTGDILLQSSSTTSTFGKLSSNSMADLSPAPTGSYGDGIVSLTVNSKGLVTNVTGVTNDKLVTKKRYVTNPDSWNNVAGGTQLPQDVWVEFQINDQFLGLSLPRTPKGALIYMQRITTTPLSATDYVKIRCSRSLDSGLGNNLYDPDGGRVFYADCGSVVGFQFSTPVSNVTANTISFHLKDTGPTNSYWRLSIQAFEY